VKIGYLSFHPGKGDRPTEGVLLDADKASLARALGEDLKRASRSSTYHCGGDGRSSGSKEEKADRERERHAFLHAPDPMADALQYDLFPGAVTVNDVWGVVPTDEAITKVAHAVCSDVVLQLVQRMNNGTAAGEDCMAAVAVDDVEPSP